MPEFRMPTLGADMEEGTLLEWLVEPGAQVAKGDVVAVIETAKSSIEVECFDSGTVERLLVEPGTTVAVGTPLAVIAPSGAAAAVGAGDGEAEGKAKAEAVGAEWEEAAEAPGEAAEVEHELAAELVEEPAAELVEEPATLAPAPAPAAAHALDEVRSPLVRHLAEEANIDLSVIHGTGPGGVITRADVQEAASPHGRRRVTPLARRLASELGVALPSVRGSGSAGAVRAADVRRAAAAARRAGPTTPTPTPAPPGPTAPSGIAPVAPAAPAAPDEAAAAAGQQRDAAMRKAIADLMSRAKREIPHYYLSTTIDLERAMAWMREHNRRSPVSERLVPAALLLKASARAATRVPALNGFWTDGRFVPAQAVHLGVAVALRGGGLIAPALHNADTLGLPGLMAALRDLVTRARTGRLRASETADPTLTVTSLGDQGVEAVYGVIYPPQVALVGFGRVVERPWAVDGLLGVRPVVTATLSADHRASDGAVGARYLAAVDQLMQHPEEL